MIRMGQSSFPPSLRRGGWCSVAGWCLAAAVAALAGIAGGCSSRTAVPAGRYEYTQLHLGVQVRIVLYAGKEEEARDAARAAFARIASLEDVFSDYRPHSEVRRLTARSPSEPIPLSTELYRVLDAALSLAARTGGAFDPTVGPIVMLWRETRRTGVLPDSAALAFARARTGWDTIRLDPSAQTATLSRADLALDLGSIAKGYILDEALAVLGRSGLRSALIEAGGDIVVSDAPPGRAGWQVTVDGAPADFAARAGSLVRAAISTSGDTEQFVEIGGVRYSHVVDPRTGQALTNHTTATVIAPDGMTADAYATALTVLDRSEREALLLAWPYLQAFVRPSGSQKRL
jgi:thiamine biosynthesis lipoprotein